MASDFSVDRHRLRIIIEDAEAANATTKKAHERARDLAAVAHERKQDFDTVGAAKASRNRNLDPEIERQERARHEAAVATAQAAYDEAVSAAEAAAKSYESKRIAAQQAMGLRDSCIAFAAARGINL